MPDTPDIRHGSDAAQEPDPDGLAGRLVDEAARLLAEHGPAGLSLRRVAAAAGTSTMAVYTRFGDKGGLLRAMYREGFRRLGERMAAGAGAPPAREGTDGEPQDRLSGLTAAGHAYRDAALASPHLYALMFGPPPPGLEPDDESAEVAGATYRPLEEGVREAVARGLLVGDPERIARHLWTVAHGAVSLELSGRLGLDPQDAVRRYDDALLLAALPFAPD